MIKLSEEDISNINAFEIVTKARVLDYVKSEGTLYFVAAGKSMADILGKDGETIRGLQNRLDKKIRVFQASEDLKEFVRSLIGGGIQSFSVRDDKSGKNRTLKISVEKEKKPLVIGRGGRNLEVIKELLRRRFGITKVILK